MTLVAQHRLTIADVAARERELAEVAKDNPAAWLKPGALSGNGVAVAGQDGFLFIANGANQWERQYAGAAPGEPWLQTWIEVLQRRQAEAARRGVELWNVVLPEKQVIYPEMRWPTDPPDAGRRPLKRIQASIESSVRLFYGEDALQACKANGVPAYAARDSHWSASGCLAVVGELVQRLAPGVDFAARRFPVDEWLTPRDLSRHFFEPAPAEPMLTIGFEGERVFDNEQFIRTGRHQGSVFVQRNARAPDARRVVLFGDSFAYDQGFAGALTSVFAEVTLVWSKTIAWSAVAERAADVVIAECAERFLVTAAES